MYSFFLKGGIFMWPLLIFSILTVAIIIEKSYYFLLVRIDERTFLNNIKKFLKNNEINKAIEYSNNEKSPISKIINIRLKINDVNKEDREKILVRVGTEEIRKMEKNLRGLAIIANISPLIGLLGTVTGLIKSFIKIESLNGNINPSLVAGGIWEALITTAAGLFIAIIALFFYHYFEGKVDNISYKMKESLQLLDEWVKLNHNYYDDFIEDIEYGI